MAKRIADKELTDRNWDQEEESEDAGTFCVASQDVLKGREIKKAKRRNPGSDAEGSGAFKGFKGLFSATGASFGALGSDSAAAKPFPSLTNGSRTTSLFTSKPAGETTQSFGSLFTNGPMSTATDGTSSTAKTNGEKPSPTSSSGPNKSVGSTEYNKQLTSLNCSVRDWIVKHVNANPLCDLTPIFKDYEKYLATIEQKFGTSMDSGSESDGSKGTPTIPSFANVETKPSFSFTCKESKSEPPAQSSPEKPSPPASLFSFGQKTDASSFGSFGSGTAAGFSFTSGAASLFGKDTSKSSSGITSFSIQSISTKKSEDSGGGGTAAAADEEAEEPPVVVVQEIKEDDAFYSKKCKLFYKKDNEFKEKGVGTLHLKTLGDQKTQLLIRADTNLGNILLNILVQPSMPCSRTGKNNVMIVCVPNPPVDEKNPTVPATMLVRVKTTEDADELHKLLLEKKGA